MSDHWQVYYRTWTQLTPPLRPHAQVVAGVREQIQGIEGRTILLGVTPELADIRDDLVAVDRNISMIAHVWPGNTARRRAVAADWRHTNFTDGAFSVCLGDGSLCVLPYPCDVTAVLRELHRIVRSGGRVVSRLYLSPDEPENLRELKDAALSGAVRNFHALKIRIAMVLASQSATPSVPVPHILEAFNAMFPERTALVAAAGLSLEQIDTIDLYRGSNVVFSFPNRDQLMSVIRPFFPGARLVACGSYDMSERCPLLVADRP